MSAFGNLSQRDQAVIRSKLCELGERTGKSWDLLIMDKRGQEEISPPLLEIIVDGRASRPIPLPTSEPLAVKVICDQLDSFAGVQID